MTVGELIEILEQLDQDAFIGIGIAFQCGVEVKPLELCAMMNDKKECIAILPQGSQAYYESVHVANEAMKKLFKKAT